MFAVDRGLEMKIRMVDYSSHDSPYRSDEHQRDEYSPNIEDTLRSLRKKLEVEK